MGTALASLIDGWQGKHVLVVGDAMHDRYIFGQVERLSPEGPVPIFVPRHFEARPGGAGNVNNQLKALGIKSSSNFSYRRSVKTRYMVGSHLMLRVDEDLIDSPQEQDIEAARQYIRTKAHAVVLSDYAKGWLTQEMCESVIECAKLRKIPVIVDPKLPDWSKFHGADVICPNTEEYTTGLCREYIPGTAVIEKRGPLGIRLHTEGGFKDFRAEARQVYDVTGAGDTVVAVVAATLAQGGTLEEACQLANLAAGWVVGEIGTTVITAEKLKCLI